MRLYQNFLGGLSSHLNLNKTPPSSYRRDNQWTPACLWRGVAVVGLPVTGIDRADGSTSNSKHEVRCCCVLRSSYDTADGCL